MVYNAFVTGVLLVTPSLMVNHLGLPVAVLKSVIIEYQPQFLTAVLMKICDNP